MANILFKRGLHASLPTTAVDGTFYLTTDSHRLYAGIGSKLVDLNQYINVVNTVDGASDSLAALTNVQLGDFAYVKTGNILAIYQEVKEGNSTVRKWIQINVNDDTKNSAIAFSGSGNADDATLKITLTDSAGADVDAAARKSIHYHHIVYGSTVFKDVLEVFTQKHFCAQVHRICNLFVGGIYPGIRLIKRKAQIFGCVNVALNGTAGKSGRLIAAGIIFRRIGITGNKCK